MTVAWETVFQTLLCLNMLTITTAWHQTSRSLIQVDQVDLNGLFILTSSQISACPDTCRDPIIRHFGFAYVVKIYTYMLIEGACVEVNNLWELGLFLPSRFEGSDSSCQLWPEAPFLLSHLASPGLVFFK